jgi:hypothetical protein
MEWSEAEDVTPRRALHVTKTRGTAILFPKIVEICTGYVPANSHVKIEAAVRSGLANGCQFLMKDPRDISDEALWRGLFALPSYWEPPVTRCELVWPHHQRQAYRWAAAILAYAIRNALEDLHTKYIPDALMPSVNRTARNTIFELIVDIPALGWRLTKMPRAFISANDHCRLLLCLPRVAG